MNKLEGISEHILSEEQRNDGYDVRIFTPGGEVPFAGHPTLGTAFVIREEILKQPVETIHLNLKVGRPSLLYLKAAQHNNSIDVNVGGRVVKITEGKLI